MPHSKTESDDAFAGMHDLISQAAQNKETPLSSQKSKTSTGEYSEINALNPETGTKIYVGKKSTGASIINPVRKLKDTALSAITIDTNCKETSGAVQSNSPDTTSISLTSIDTDASEHARTYKESNFPIIIEEEVSSSTIDPEIPIPQFHKKKEKPHHSSNLSLDISSDNTDIAMPKGNELSPLGSGVVTAVLGSGGMAKVYKIWNEKLEVNRAVKILLPSHRKESYKRFQTEAKISAKLHHPNIVEIHSIGDWNNLPFIEMELVEGDTLNAIISRFKVLPSIFCSAVAVHVARALEYAHSKDVLIYGKTYKGIIHRDLKPSNIIIGKHGIVKLMDFGVARPIATGLHTINVDTLIGTMHYFSPEQINGNSIDQLSDIYSFGAVLYEMLCGANPFPQSSMIELVRAKIKNQFTRLEDYHIPFDPRLASVAQICLRTDKSSRLESSVKLREQLELIHSSFEMGSPEEVIASFLRDPQAMYQIPEVNHYQSSIMQSIPEESETETITQNEIQVICKSEFPLISAEPDPLSVDTKAGPNKSQKNTIIILIATAVIVITTIILLTIVKPSLSFKPEFHKQITYSFNLQNVLEENALLTEVIEESNLAS